MRTIRPWPDWNWAGPVVLIASDSSQRARSSSRERVWGGRPVFRAHDKATGDILAEIELPATQTGLPMSYMVDGVQYIVIAVAADGYPAELLALRLP